MQSGKYSKGPLDMMNLGDGRTPHEAVSRVKSLEQVRKHGAGAWGRGRELEGRTVLFRLLTGWEPP